MIFVYRSKDIFTNHFPVPLKICKNCEYAELVGIYRDHAWTRQQMKRIIFAFPMARRNSIEIKRRLLALKSASIVAFLSCIG